MCAGGGGMEVIDGCVGRGGEVSGVGWLGDEKNK